jgi:hypothetical protein
MVTTQEADLVLSTVEVATTVTSPSSASLATVITPSTTVTFSFATARDHVTVLLAASSGDATTVAVNVSVPPFAMLVVSLLRLTLVIVTTGSSS